ncbi:MAG: phospholipase D family protein [Gammaproteobacteria bacterium]
MLTTSFSGVSALRAIAVAAVLAAGLSACAAPKMKNELYRPAPSYAMPPADSGILHEMAQKVFADHGPEYSGFALLDSSYDGLAMRLALIDSAQSSLDILTYLWYPDVSGRLILERAVRAAQRGVHVRLVIDDLLTAGQDALMANLQNQPNIELRLFNPWRNRDLGSRAGEMIAEMERLNSRMHDKLLVADGNAAVVGGRNIGDHYFGLSEAYNFHDLDLLGVGHIAHQANQMFDHFWNSEWVVSAANLDTPPDPELARRQWQGIQEKTRTAEQLAAFPRLPKDWTTELAAVEAGLHYGTSQLVFDEVSAPEITQSMIASMFALFGQARQELLITNAYLVPAEPGIEFLEGLAQAGVDVKLLTNSLASHDVPAVNSHYEAWRDDILRAGAELYEFRADAAIRSLVEVPPVTGEFVGLHTKAAVIDRRYAFIGSMNLDPRSANINTEMGAIVDSPGLAEALARLMERDMSGENAWQVRLDEAGRLSWTNSDETVTKQPSRDFMQEVMNVIFKIVPREQF